MAWVKGAGLEIFSGIATAPAEIPIVPTSVAIFFTSDLMQPPQKIISQLIRAWPFNLFKLSISAPSRPRLRWMYCAANNSIWWTRRLRSVFWLTTWCAGQAAAALLADVLPRVLSFTGAKRLLNAFADQLRRTSGDQVRALVATVTASIATLRLPYRPDRIEPRAKKRRPKNLPLLTVPRQVAREIIYAQRMLNRVP